MKFLSSILNIQFLKFTLLFNSIFPRPPRGFIWFIARDLYIRRIAGRKVKSSPRQVLMFSIWSKGTLREGKRERCGRQARRAETKVVFRRWCCSPRGCRKAVQCGEAEWRVGEMKHSFTRALTARKVDFMMIITGESSKSGWRKASLGRTSL